MLRSSGKGLNTSMFIFLVLDMVDFRSSQATVMTPLVVASHNSTSASKEDVVMDLVDSNLLVVDEKAPLTAWIHVQ